MEYWKINKEKSEEHWLELLDISCDESIWWKAIVKWDGCIHLDNYGNVPYNLDLNREDKDCCDNYIHICDLDNYIKRLEELRNIAKEYFKEEQPNWPDF